MMVVLPERIELSTSPLPRGCSTTELRQRDARAGGQGIDEAPPLGKASGRQPTALPRRGNITGGLWHQVLGTRICRPCLAVMVWHGSTIDPTRDVAAGAVLDAFEEARSAGTCQRFCRGPGTRMTLLSVLSWSLVHCDAAPTMRRDGR